MKIQFEEMNKRIKNIQAQLNKVISFLNKNVNGLKQKISESNM